VERLEAAQTAVHERQLQRWQMVRLNCLRLETGDSTTATGIFNKTRIMMFNKRLSRAFKVIIIIIIII